MPIGYLKKTDLLESNRRSKDIAALDNLGGAGIHEDILIFANNLSNTTTIFSREYKFDEEGTITLTTVNKIAFSNGTKVTHNSEPCIVEKSDINSKFVLRSETTNLIVTDLGYDIVRSNAVTGLNMQLVNLVAETTKQLIPDVPPKESTVYENNSRLQPYTFTDLVDLDDFQGYSDESTTGYLETLNRSMESTARFFKDYKLTTEDISFRTRLNLDGTIRLRNDLNEYIFNPDSPGIYIADDAGNVKKAFSSNIDPWLLEDGGITKTEATETYTKSLIATNLELENVTTNNVISNEQFTHRLEIEVDGEIVNILLKETTEPDE